jgi:hypothetical protein
VEEERLRRIDAALDAAAEQAARQHHSPAAVARVLMTALRGALSSVVEELDELTLRVAELERLAQGS